MLYFFIGVIVSIYAIVFLASYADKLRIQKLGVQNRTLLQMDVVLLKLDITKHAHLTRNSYGIYG